VTRAERRFRGAVREELARRKAGVTDARLVILDLLRLMQADVRGVLRRAPSDFDRAFLPRLLSEVDGAMERWNARVEDAALGIFEDAARLGPRLVQAPLSAMGIELGGPLISEHLLRSAANWSADKLALGLADGRAAIEAHIRLGVLGGRSPHEVMAGISKELGDDAGPFRKVSLRAEMIMRTETGRIHSMATQARMDEAADLVPDLGKEWQWSGKSRMSHSAVNGQRRKVSEPFDVGGEQLMHPRDPDGSAGNTVACGCESIPYLARWADTPNKETEE